VPLAPELGSCRPGYLTGVRWRPNAQPEFRPYRLCNADLAVYRDAGGGTRTPDTRIMIPPAIGSSSANRGRVVADVVVLRGLVTSSGRRWSAAPLSCRGCSCASLGAWRRVRVRHGSCSAGAAPVSAPRLRRPGVQFGGNLPVRVPRGDPRGPPQAGTRRRPVGSSRGHWRHGPRGQRARTRPALEEQRVR
jgi:hypothetical protein